MWTVPDDASSNSRDIAGPDIGYIDTQAHAPPPTRTQGPSKTTHKYAVPPLGVSVVVWAYPTSARRRPYCTVVYTGRSDRAARVWGLMGVRVCVCEWLDD